jgi:serine/threonine protein kinase
MKRKLNLDMDETVMMQSLSCEIDKNGIRFKTTGIKITKDGVTKDNMGGANAPLSSIKSDEIELGAYIGKGSCGYVQEGIYTPQFFPIAIKTINGYDKDKRHQILNDLKIFLSEKIDLAIGKYEPCDNVVQYYGAFYEEGSIKIIMELMDIGSLRDVLDMVRQKKTKPPYIDEPYLASITYQILNGMNYLHTKKHQIHRDIKPENILINSLGQVKLTDFGISKELEKTQGLAHTFVGTMSYMSPERLDGKPYGFSSDLWSLGLLVIELATGEYPYVKRNKFFEMISNILHSPEPTLPDNGLYSVELRDFLKLILSKDPKLRSPAAELMKHPWFIKNAAFNPNVSEWVTRLLFECKFQKDISFTEDTGQDLINKTIASVEDLYQKGYTYVNGINGNNSTANNAESNNTMLQEIINYTQSNNNNGMNGNGTTTYYPPSSVVSNGDGGGKIKMEIE